MLDRRIRVVLVDDTEDVRELIRFSLDVDGRFTVVGEAGDGLEGVRVADTEQPDVVLLDVAMPVMDGTKALPLIRERVPHAAIVVYTAYGTNDTLDELNRLGADDIVLKTSRPSEVANRMAAAVAARQAETTASSG